MVGETAWRRSLAAADQCHLAMHELTLRIFAIHTVLLPTLHTLKTLTAHTEGLPQQQLPMHVDSQRGGICMHPGH